MATALFINCGFSWSNSKHMLTPIPSHSMCCSSSQNEALRTRVASGSKGADFVNGESEKRSTLPLNRRTILSFAVSVLGFPRNSLAAVKQGLLAGRIPGLSESDEQGWRTYRRPDEKSGGHGVGWSPIIPYTFSVPQDWEEVIINKSLAFNVGNVHCNSIISQMIRSLYSRWNMDCSTVVRIKTLHISSPLLAAKSPFFYMMDELACFAPGMVAWIIWLWLL